MYNSWLMYELAKERQEEFLKEVETERLIRKNQSKSKSSRSSPALKVGMRAISYFFRSFFNKNMKLHKPAHTAYKTKIS